MLHQIMNMNWTTNQTSYWEVNELFFEILEKPKIKNY